MSRMLLSALLAFAIAPSALSQTNAGEPAPRRVGDAPYRSGFVRANGVRLHYLDWGGEGETLLFLAGLGGTAHGFDDIAPKFTDRFHVLALTRRGFGQSDQPDTGYDNPTLVEDIRGFLDALHIKRVHLVGHSIAGAEMTSFAGRYPERVGKLVYIEAAYDRHAGQHTFRIGDTNPLKFPQPTADDLASFDSFFSYVRRARPDMTGLWSNAEIASILETVEIQPGGAVRLRTPPKVESAVRSGAGAAPPSYGQVRAPALAFYALRDSPPAMAAAQTPEVRERLQEWWDKVYKPWQRQSIEQFRAGARRGEIVEMPDSVHMLYRQREDEVVRRMREFLLRK